MRIKRLNEVFDSIQTSFFIGNIQPLPPQSIKIQLIKYLTLPPMKNLYSKLLVVVALMLPFNIFAQSSGVNPSKCLAHHYYEEMLATDPAFRSAQNQLETETQQYVNQYIADRQAGNQRNASVVRVIPVVFHVIHEGGAENITRAQIVDQID